MNANIGERHRSTCLKSPFQDLKIPNRTTRMLYKSNPKLRIWESLGFLNQFSAKFLYIAGSNSKLLKIVLLSSYSVPSRFLESPITIFSMGNVKQRVSTRYCNLQSNRNTRNRSDEGIGVQIALGDNKYGDVVQMFSESSVIPRTYYKSIKTFSNACYKNAKAIWKMTVRI